MSVVAIRCPSCNGDVELDQDREFGFCVYCGTKIYIPNAVQRIKGIVSIDNSGALQSLLVLADRSKRIDQYEEAIRHYDAILVIDPNNSEAILYKGLCTIALGNPTGLSYLLSYGANAFAQMLTHDEDRVEERITDIMRFLRLAAERLSVSIQLYEQGKVNNYATKQAICGDIMRLAQVWESFDACMDESFMTMSTAFLNAYRSTYGGLRNLLDWSRVKEKDRSQKIPSIERRIASMDKYRETIQKRLVRQYWEQHSSEYAELKRRLNELKGEAQNKAGLLRKIAIDHEIKTIRNRINKPC